MTSSAPASRIGEILFVLGAPRSGTTLLNRLLLDYFDYGMGPEGHWIAPLAARAASYGDLAEEENLRRLIHDVIAQDMFEIVRQQYGERFGWPIDVTEERVRDALPEPTYAGVTYAALSVLATQLRRHRVGSKDPGFYRVLDTLHDLFPTQARYVCVVRDGRDVALSMMRQPWGQKSWYANARLWVETYARIETHRSRIPAERFFLLRYEDLLREPDATCRALEGFLSAPLEQDRRTALVEEISTGARSRNFDKWKDRMGARDHRLFEAVAGPWLDHFDYERTMDAPRAYLWERAMYGGLEYARRIKRKALLSLGVGRTDVPTSTAASSRGS